MRNLLYILPVVFLAIVSCEDDDVNLFDKTADERAAEAVANLKEELTSPSNGWLVRYKPQEGFGSYYVLLNFAEDDKVVIRTDLGAEDGEYFVDTVYYRVDNSLGLELIIENYSFFSFLFEQDQATFGAEYEFNYANKTPDGDLVFRSKTDTSTPDVIVFQEASPDDINLLGVALAQNLNTLSGDFKKFTSSLRMTYGNRDLALYLSLDELRRTVTITSASLKSNTASRQQIGYTTGYLIEGDRIVLEAPFEGTVLGSSVSIASLRLDDIGEATLSVCAEPITIHTFSGETSAGDAITLETSLLDVSGASFAQLSDFYFSPLVYISQDGESMGEQIQQDIAGALEMHMYYGYEIGNGELLYGIGFVIENTDGSITFALREFTPVLTDNRITFNFAAEISLYGNQTPTANIENVNIYLNALTEGNNTYAFLISEDVYEFYNPCTGWSFVFINANR